MPQPLLMRAALALAILAPLALAATSPLLAWRDPFYIIAGFAGILALGLLVAQPLLITGVLGLAAPQARRAHRLVGAAIALAVLAHLAGLWVASPPDVIDALLFRSPTPFSAWGVVGLLAVLITACFAAFRRRLRLHPRVWRGIHLTLAGAIVLCSVVHAVQIEGTMEPISKYALCALALLAGARLLLERRGAQ